jgi:hypothetical protein
VLPLELPLEPPLLLEALDAATIATEAEADCAVLAADSAVTVTDGGEGTLKGAVYTPEVDTVPTLALPPIIPLTSQITVVLLVYSTVAVKDCMPPAGTVGLVGDIDTDTCAMVTVACPDCVGSATDTADTVTLAGAGIAAGAVYSPALDMVPTVALPPTTPLTCQVTAVFVVLETVAVKVCVLSTASVALVGVTPTTTCTTVTTAEADCAGLATDTADTVTVAGVGITAGAV